MHPPKGEAQKMANALDWYRLRIVWLILLQHRRVNVNTQRFSNAHTVIYICAEEVAQLAHLNILTRTT
jgi:hypothetical protein